MVATCTQPSGQLGQLSPWCPVVLRFARGVTAACIVLRWCTEGEEGGDAAAKAAEAAFKVVMAEIEIEDVHTEDEESLLSRLGQLDLLLTWLWRVHGIDYYGGKELLLEADYMDRSHLQRTLRGQRPEEGEEQDEAEGGWRGHMHQLRHQYDR